jgi:hypothetical protein
MCTSPAVKASGCALLNHVADRFGETGPITAQGIEAGPTVALS